MKYAKDKAVQVKSTFQRVTRNLEQFIQASALLILAGFSLWALKQVEIHQAAEWVVTGAIAVIALRGAWEFFNFLNKGE